MKLSIRYLDHATDAFIEIVAANLEDAFNLAAISVVQTTLDISTVQEKDTRHVVVTGKDLFHLLFNWLEEIIYQLITEGFAISKITLSIKKNTEYVIDANLKGEPLDLEKHKFKIEIKAPTFHQMNIKQNDKITMQFLLDL